MALRQPVAPNATHEEVELLLSSLEVKLLLAMSLGLLVGLALLWFLTRY